MKLISPSAELWTQGTSDESIIAHVARCARVCYQSQKTDGNERLVKNLMERKHLSMFRHVTYYFRLSSEFEADMIRYLLHHKYILHAVRKTQHLYYFAVNGQTWLEFTEDYRHRLLQYQISEQAIAQDAEQVGKEKAFELLGIVRTSICCTTQISTSREMNRVSPNNIAEQSTRYVNFGKRGGITICKPWWYNAFTPMWKKCFTLTCWKLQEWMYDLALLFGMRPEDARGFLPLDAGTRVVYTYSGKEWRHIMDLRLRDKTGPAHPNAKQLAQEIQEAVNMKMKVLNREYSI